MGETGIKLEADKSSTAYRLGVVAGEIYRIRTNARKQGFEPDVPADLIQQHSELHTQLSMELPG